MVQTNTLMQSVNARKLMSSMSSTSSITLARTLFGYGSASIRFAVTNYRQPRPVEDYVSVIGDRYPHLRLPETYQIHAHLFARTVQK